MSRESTMLRRQPRSPGTPKRHTHRFDTTSLKLSYQKIRDVLHDCRALAQTTLVRVEHVVVILSAIRVRVFQNVKVD